MVLINLNAEIVACILAFRKSRHKPNLENTSKYGFPADLGGKNGGVLSMRMQIILGPVAQNVDNAIHRINHYPADSVVCFVNTYPLDSDLSGG